MFTGLIEEVGSVRSVSRSGHYQKLEFSAQKVLEGTTLGDSIAVNGVCLTVTHMGRAAFAAETLDATLEKTTLGGLVRGRRVNLERALTLSSRLGGHIVQGHVDGVATVRDIRRNDHNVYLSVELPHGLERYCIPEGSTAIDGISLTIATLDGRIAEMNIIPATWKETTLADRKPGDRINVETDVLARYVERLLHRSVGIAESRPGDQQSNGLTMDHLHRLGF